MALDKAGLFACIADALEGKAKGAVRIAVTATGSEHPAEMLVAAAKDAQSFLDNVEVVVLAPVRALMNQKIQRIVEDFPSDDFKINGITGIAVENLCDAHKTMETMFEKKAIDAAVTMHYNFPLGISTVGRVMTPGRGKPMFIATTTGTAAANRVEAMVKNTIYGIATAKAAGIEKPSVGILNLDGARQVERILKLLTEKGYEINFAGSVRADGGCIMRGNDLLSAACDVMVADTLTGNILMKVFSAYTTGGDYEASGWGYGPGVGEKMEKIVMILSRASGAPVVEGAIQYAAGMVRGNLIKKVTQEFEKLRSLDFDRILRDHIKDRIPAGGGLLQDAGVKNPVMAEAGTLAPGKEAPEIVLPSKKPVTKEIGGIDVLQMEDAAEVLLKNGIYAETGMGCTGPVILVAEEDLKQAVEILKAEGQL